MAVRLCVRVCVRARLYGPGVDLFTTRTESPLPFAFCARPPSRSGPNGTHGTDGPGRSFYVCRPRECSSRERDWNVHISSFFSRYLTPLSRYFFTRARAATKKNSRIPKATIRELTRLTPPRRFGVKISVNYTHDSCQNEFWQFEYYLHRKCTNGRLIVRQKPRCFSETCVIFILNIIKVHFWQLPQTILTLSDSFSTISKNQAATTENRE